MLMIWMMEVKCLYINWLWNFFIYMAVMILFHSDWKFRSWFPRRHTVLSDRVIDSIDDYLSPNSQIQIIVNRYRSLFTWFKIMSLPDRLSCLSIEHCGCLQLIAGEILIQAVSGVRSLERPFVIDTEHGRLQARGMVGVIRALFLWARMFTSNSGLLSAFTSFAFAMNGSGCWAFAQTTASKHRADGKCYRPRYA